MKDILSQAEIDELIRNLNSPEEELIPAKKEKVKSYDFRRPSKFTREQIRAIEDIFSNFSKMLSLRLADLLRSTAFLEVTYIEEQTFYEYTNSLQKSSLIGIFEFEQSEYNASVELSYSVVQSFINLLLGGSSQSRPELFSGFTEIEINLTKKVLKTFIQPMIEAWKNYVDLTIDFQRVENMGQHVQIAAPSDVIIIVTLRIQVAESEGFINFCLPYLLLEPVLKNIGLTQGFTRIAKDEGISYENYLKGKMDNNYLELVCNLGQAYLTLEDLQEIQVGDVIKLRKRVEQKADLLINNIPKYNVDLGRKDNSYAIRISNIIERIV